MNWLWDLWLIERLCTWWGIYTQLAGTKQNEIRLTTVSLTQTSRPAKRQLAGRDLREHQPSSLISHSDKFSPKNVIHLNFGLFDTGLTFQLSAVMFFLLMIRLSCTDPIRKLFFRQDLPITWRRSLFSIANEFFIENGPASPTQTLALVGSLFSDQLYFFIWRLEVYDFWQKYNIIGFRNFMRRLWA